MKRIKKILWIGLLSTLIFLQQGIQGQNAKADKPVVKQAAAPPEQVKAQEKKSSGFEYKFGGLLQIRSLTADQYQLYQGGASADANTTIQLKRAEVAVNGSLNKKVTFTVMMDFARYPGVFNAPADRAVLPTQDVFLDYKYIPYANIRIGQFFTLVTMESLQPSGDLFFIERATHTGGGTLFGAPAGTVQYGDQRDIGTMLSYQFGKTGAPFFEYAIGIFQGGSQNNVEQDEHKSISAKIDLRPFGKSFTIGVSGQRDTSSLEIERKDRFGGHLLFLWDKLTASFETMQGVDLGQTNLGLYGALLYNLDKAIGAPLEPGVRYDIFLRDTPGVNQKVSILTLGLNYNLIKNRARLQLNYVNVSDENPNITDHQVGINTQVTF